MTVELKAICAITTPRALYTSHVRVVVVLVVKAICFGNCRYFVTDAISRELAAIVAQTESMVWQLSRAAAFGEEHAGDADQQDGHFMRRHDPRKAE